MLSVNLTTTSERLSLCRIALTSLLMQSRLPDQINLWVSREPYLSDKGIPDEETVNRLVMSLPETNRQLIKIRWTKNTGPYRKLIPALREAAPADLIVTADDDIFYGEKWLSTLLAEYESGEGRAVAGRVRQITYNFIGKRTSYMHWGLINEKKVVDRDYIVTFGGGAVLTRSMFRENDIHDDTFLDAAPRSDDLWYTKLLNMAKQEVIIEPSAMSELYFLTHPHGLANSNLAIGETSLLRRVMRRLWVSSMGRLGWLVCGNDFAFMSIESHFSAEGALAS